MSANNGKIPRAEALEVVRTSIEGRSFSVDTAYDDVNFANNLLQWLIFRFAVYPADLRISSGTSDGYLSTSLPDSVRQMFLSKEVSGERHARPVCSAIRYVSDPEVVPSRLPLLDALLEQGMNFTQIILHFMENPDDLKGASLARCYPQTKYAVSFGPGYGISDEWGVRLVCDARDIRVAPFGKDGETEPAVSITLPG